MMRSAIRTLFRLTLKPLMAFRGGVGKKLLFFLFCKAPNVLMVQNWASASARRGRIEINGRCKDAESEEGRSKSSWIRNKLRRWDSPMRYCGWKEKEKKVLENQLSSDGGDFDVKTPFFPCQNENSRDSFRWIESAENLYKFLSDFSLLLGLLPRVAHACTEEPARSIFQYYFLLAISNR